MAGAPTHTPDYGYSAATDTTDTPPNEPAEGLLTLSTPVVSFCSATARLQLHDSHDTLQLGWADDTEQLEQLQREQQELQQLQQLQLLQQQQQQLEEQQQQQPPPPEQQLEQQQGEVDALLPDQAIGDAAPAAAPAADGGGAGNGGKRRRPVSCFKCVSAIVCPCVRLRVRIRGCAVACTCV